MILSMLYLKDYPKLTKLWNILLVGFGVVYPFILFWKPLVELRIFFVVAILLWIIQIIVTENTYEKLIGVLLIVFFGFYLLFEVEAFVYLYPIAVNIILFCIFFYSLKGEAIITQIARKIHEKKGGVCDDMVVRYTRNLTKIWCWFFMLNGGIILLLTLMENKLYWTLYCGIVGYCLVGILIGGEFLYRKVILRIK